MKKLVYYFLLVLSCLYNISVFNINIITAIMSITYKVIAKFVLPIAYRTDTALNNVLIK